MKYEKLYSPLQIGNVTIKNRIALSPMSMPTGCVDHCEWSDTYIQFLVDRAAGGAGLIYTQAIAADTHVDIISPVIYPTMDPGRFIKSSRKLIDGCHENGAKIFCQLTMGTGRNGGPGFKAPSVMPYYIDKTKLAPALTREEIHQKELDYAASAKIIKDAGFDGMEIHALHWGYLFDEFATPLFNQRTDEYGGSLKNRLRFLKETIYAVRQVVGDDFPISVRLAVKTFVQGMWVPTLRDEPEVGRTPEEAAAIGRELESYGVDVLNTDMGLYDNWAFCMPNVYMPHGITFKYIDPLRAAVKIPVLVGGCRIGDGATAEAAIEAGKCDGIVMGRAFLADPDIANKIAAGREDEIRPCIGCNNCLMSEVVAGKARCAVNPVDLCEETHKIAKADKKKKVVVIGGGVTGMEAAIVSAQRGHTVDLYEKTDHLGGNLIPAGGHPFKEDIRRLNKWFIDELGRQGVNVHLNTELSADEVKALNPDAVLLAAGSHPVMPQSIKGIDRAIDAVSAATGKAVPKGNNVVVVGGGLTGCEIALDYRLQGKNVTVVEYQDKLMSVGLPTFYSNITYIICMFIGLGVKQLTGHKLEEITDEGVVVSKVSTGEKITIPADDVVVAMGLRANPSLAEELKGSGFEVYEMGDAVSIGNIATSTRSAFEICRSL
jgi:2-enoate reductase